MCFIAKNSVQISVLSGPKKKIDEVKRESISHKLLDLSKKLKSKDHFSNVKSESKVTRKKQYTNVNLLNLMRTLNLQVATNIY